MNIIYISPGYLNPHLFPVLKGAFDKQKGITHTTNPHEATHCFIEVVSGELKYDEEVLAIVKEMGIPIICWDHREWGEMKNEKWYPVDFNPDIYFVRNMSKKETYPKNVYPYDWPIFSGYDFDPATKEELYSRPFDCCLISVESPTRRNVVNGILKDGRLKLNYQFLDHTQRMPNEQWIAEHRKAKLYINCEGGGMTTERPNQLYSVAPMLQVRNNQAPQIELTDGINCLEIDEYPTQEDLDKLVDILGDKDWMYDIYRIGMEEMKKNNSPDAKANYVVDVLKKNGIA